MRKHTPKATFIPVIGLLTFTSILFLVFYSVGWASKKSYFFKIKEIIINGNDGAEIGFDYLKGRNILTIDLDKEEDFALRIYPVCKTIKLIKILPNRIFVDSVIRKPVAYLRLYKYFYVDEDGILFEAPLGLEQFELPVIFGLDSKIFGPKKGQKYEIKELLTALKIIKNIKKNIVLSNVKIKKVDASDISGISVFLTLSSAPTSDVAAKVVEPMDVLEVRFGQGYINEKVDILGNLFVQGRNDLANIKYIDLRFNDPVIKFKEL